MPIFEFRCQKCGHKFSALVGMVAGSADTTCPKCNSADLNKLVSRFVRGRNEDQRVDEIADHLETVGEPDSSHEMRKMMREMGKAMDEDMADEMEEMFESDMEGNGDDE